MPKVSVIVPVYGVEKFISRCAKSLFEQTLDDMEFIFIDDCTKDHSIDVLHKVLEKYPQRKAQTQIVKMLVNSGQAAVRKHGMQLAIGDYVIHCDSDDWIDVVMYEKMWRKAVETDSDIVFCDFYITDGYTHRSLHRNFGIVNKETILSTVICKMWWSLCGGLVKRNIVSNNPIIYPTANNGEDFAIMVQQIYYAQRFAYISECLYYYYTNPNSITQKIGLDKYLQRKEQHSSNVAVVETFFKRENVFEIYSGVLLNLKLYCRANFSDQVCDRNTRRVWHSIYPELDSEKILFNNKIAFHLKFHYWAVRLHVFSLYLILLKIKRKIYRK